MLWFLCPNKSDFTGSGAKNIRFVGGAKTTAMGLLKSMGLSSLERVLRSSICLLKMKYGVVQAISHLSFVMDDNTTVF